MQIDPSKLGASKNEISIKIQGTKSTEEKIKINIIDNLSQAKPQFTIRDSSFNAYKYGWHQLPLSSHDMTGSSAEFTFKNDDKKVKQSVILYNNKFILTPVLSGIKFEYDVLIPIGSGTFIVTNKATTKNIGMDRKYYVIQCSINIFSITTPFKNCNLVKDVDGTVSAWKKILKVVKFTHHFGIIISTPGMKGAEIHLISTETSKRYEKKISDDLVLIDSVLLAD